MSEPATYEKVVADLDALLDRDATEEATSMAKELLESSRPEIKGAACHAIAKIRLKAELLIHGPDSQVFAPAEEAIACFREVDEKRGEAAALNTLAQAYLIIGDTTNSVSTAKDANRLATGFRDKSLAASVQDTLYQAYIAAGDTAKALFAAKERVVALEAIGSQEESTLQALIDALSTLANMQLKRGMKDASRVNAEKMASLCKKLGNKEKEALANKSISMALVQSGKADQAPNRLKAVAALECAMAAAERTSESDFKKWWYEMEELGGVSATDIKKALEKIREHGGGPPGMDSFLREVGFPYIEKTSSHVIHAFTRRQFYVNFRVGGIQYGPRYQCVVPYRLGDAGGKSIATLQPSSECDVWEYQLGYHTGILDGCLQTGMVINAPTVW
jgi:hypothetical protein